MRQIRHATVFFFVMGLLLSACDGGPLFVPRTETPTATKVIVPSKTSTKTMAPSSTSTKTPLPSPTFTETFTQVPTFTETATLTPTVTPTATKTKRPTVVFVPSNTPNPCLTADTPYVVITYSPPQGVWMEAQGMACGVDPAQYKIVLYNFVPAAGGWWIKPMFAEPKTAINYYGSWSNGLEGPGTMMRAYLIPNDVEPPAAAGWSDIPGFAWVAFAEAAR